MPSRCAGQWLRPSPPAPAARAAVPAAARRRARRPGASSSAGGGASAPQVGGRRLGSPAAPAAGAGRRAPRLPIAWASSSFTFAAEFQREARHAARRVEVPGVVGRARRSRGSRGRAPRPAAARRACSASGTSLRRKAVKSLSAVRLLDRAAGSRGRTGGSRPAPAARAGAGARRGGAARSAGSAASRQAGLGRRACGATSGRGSLRSRSLRSVLPRGPRRPSASGSARSRLRLWNSRSTWCSATKRSASSAQAGRHGQRLQQVGAGIRRRAAPRPASTVTACSAKPGAASRRAQHHPDQRRRVLSRLWL